MAADALAIENLDIAFGRRGTLTTVVDRVSLRVEPREIVGLIGESGSGKTITALSVLGLLPRGARVTGGRIAVDGTPVLGFSPRQWRALRGNRVALIPQDALRAMNPGLTVGRQVGEPVVIHGRGGWRAALRRATDLLGSVHLREPQRRVMEYPHQFSGGMQQRAMIGMGLALEPRLLIADEPTTALDVTVQAQVLALLREIRDTHGAAILFITHDLGVVKDLCDRVYVMYAGHVVEQGPVRALFDRPAHPYTRALLRATPTVHSVTTQLEAIPGQIPLPRDWPRGCHFQDRCPLAFARCTTLPPLAPLSEDRAARCWAAAP
jgi:oligopeptide/dipeptide ABC transporter ATP-binding protein